MSETLKSIRIPMRAKKYHLLINQSQAKNNASFWLSMIRNLSAIDMLHDLVAKLPGNLKLKLKGKDQKLTSSYWNSTLEFLISIVRYQKWAVQSDKDCEQVSAGFHRHWLQSREHGAHFQLWRCQRTRRSDRRKNQSRKNYAEDKLETKDLVKKAWIRLKLSS